MRSPSPLPKTSENINIKALIYDDGWHSASNNIGKAITVTYGFANKMASYLNFEESTQWNSSLKVLANTALQSVQDFTLINFKEVSAEQSAMTFHNMEMGYRKDYISPEVSGYDIKNYPDGDMAGGGASPTDVKSAINHIDGDVAIDNDFFSSPEKYADNTYAKSVLYHELGHALGLDHPHEKDLLNNTNSQKYSIMSYTNDTNGLKASTYMVYDIFALQHLYGADYEYNSGNTTYNLGVNGSYWNQLKAVWDGGGIDTLDARQAIQDVILDLNQGAYSSVGNTQNFGIAFGVTIENAHGGKFNDELIGNHAENRLYGHNGNDNLIGNAGNDILFGHAGNDTLNGGTGNDLLFGGAGADKLVGGQGVDRVSYIYATTGTHANLSNVSLNTGEAKGDTYNSIENLQGSKFNDVLTGNASNNNIWGNDGNDVLKGLSGNDNLYGQKGNDKAYGGSGDDKYIYDTGIDYFNGESGNDSLYFTNFDKAVWSSLTREEAWHREDENLYKGTYTKFMTFDSVENLYGSKYNDAFYGNEKSNKLYGNNGDDYLYGEAGNDYLYGQNGNDKISGQSGDDRVFGGAGDDLLQGGQGFDLLYGGDGADQFYLNALDNGANRDSVRDFSISQGDSLIIEGLLDFADTISSAIADFISLTENSKSTLLYVDLDGTGQTHSKELLADLFGLKDAWSNITDMLDQGDIKFI